jgi:two-component system chemotaxis response regulator CheB
MKPIRVLVVDDSAFARKVVRELLEASPDVEVVGIARDGFDALEKIDALAPDVVTLDLVMPNLDGLGVLAAREGKPSPRFVVVSTASEDSDLALAALAAGAIELVAKGTALATDRLYEMGEDLLQKVRIAAHARAPAAARPVAPAPAAGRRSARRDVLVLGASTGGPQALTRLVAELPEDFPIPIAVALHMPVGYTASLSERLDGHSRLHVVEAYTGLALTPGVVAIGRAGMHLKLAGGSHPQVVLDAMPAATAHHPSVDVLFESAAAAFGARVLAIVLTGMGDDGLKGARLLRAAGADILTEAEGSCVVYGMPRAVAEAGLSSKAVSLERLIATIDDYL